MLSATTKLLLPGRGVGRWWQEWQLRSALDYLIITEQILEPKDGQIEAKKTGMVDVGCYVSAILQQLGQMAKPNPNYPAFFQCFDCGNALYQLGRYEEAIESYEKVLEIKPNLHAVRCSLGNALCQLGRKEEAIESYDKALEFNPGDHNAWHNRGVALYELGRKEEAIESYDKALEFNPGDHDAWHNRGVVLYQLERKEEAIESYDKALEFNPDLYQSWDNRGYVLSALGRYEEALINYDKALQIQPDSANAHYNKAYCYGLQKEIDLAIESLQHAINLDSKYRELAKTDSDFDGIRDSDRFRELIGE